MSQERRHTSERWVSKREGKINYFKKWSDKREGNKKKEKEIDIEDIQRILNTCVTGIHEEEKQIF